MVPWVWEETTCGWESAHVGEFALGGESAHKRQPTRGESAHGRQSARGGESAHGSQAAHAESVLTPKCQVLSGTLHQHLMRWSLE